MYNFLKKIWHVYLPQWVKTPIVFIVNGYGRLKGKIYIAAANGRIWFPDKAFQTWNYKIHMGKSFDFHNPGTFNEKLQWLKYYYRRPDFTNLADKYEVRNYIKEIIGEDVLIPCYGVYEQWDDIPFDSLPDKFVIKCTHDSGSVVICKDKKLLNINEAKTKIEAGLARNQFYLSREWVYKNIKPRIIIEKLLEDSEQSDIRDYKCMCFNGKMKCLYVCSGRGTVTGPFLDFFDINWNPLNVFHVYPNNPNKIPKPLLLNKMIEYSEKISEDKPFVRVDFYEVSGKLYFGEITFFPSGGYQPYIPQSFDELMGSWITLPTQIG